MAGNLHEELSLIAADDNSSLAHDLWDFGFSFLGRSYNPYHDGPICYYRERNRVVARWGNAETKVPKSLSRRMLLRALKLARQKNRRGRGN